MARDPLFAQALKVTTIYTLVYVPMEMIGGMSLALLVNQKVRGVGVFRTIFYLPSVLAGVAYVVVVHKQQRAASFRCIRIQDHLTVGRLRPGLGGAILPATRAADWANSGTNARIVTVQPNTS